MSQTTAIEWAEATLNPWTGCSKVSPGCARCYIPRTPPFRIAGRKFVGGDIPLVFHMERLERMIRRRKPTLYFVNSLSDLFHEDASNDQIAQVFGAMAAARHHTFQCLTKRPERMRHLLGTGWFGNEVNEWALHYGDRGDFEYPLPNCWLGVTIENRRFVHRADLLRQTPAAVRFISAEPLLGPLIADYFTWRNLYPDREPTGAAEDYGWEHGWDDGYEGESLDLTDIDWLIAGGESGKGYRRLDLRWMRDLRDACAASGTAYFVKQLGGTRPGSKLEDLPEDLRIREWPRSVVTA